MSELLAFVRARIDEDQRDGRMSRSEARALEAILGLYTYTDPGDRVTHGATVLRRMIFSLASIWRDHADYPRLVPHQHRADARGGLHLS
ncbi:MAG: hypothetical protein ACRDYU_09330 [Actinomycetes bacterium]